MFCAELCGISNSLGVGCDTDVIMAKWALVSGDATVSDCFAEFSHDNNQDNDQDKSNAGSKQVRSAKQAVHTMVATEHVQEVLLTSSMDIIRHPSSEE